MSKHKGKYSHSLDGEATTYAVSVVRSQFAVEDVQQAYQVCAISSALSDPVGTQVLVTLSDPAQAEDFTVTFAETGETVEFSEDGAFFFTPVNLNTCANLLITFKEPGEYKFTFALQEIETNITLATNFQTVNVLED